MLRRLLLIPLLLVLASAAPAQSELLDGYVEQGLKSNQALQRRQLDVSRAIAQLRQAKAAFFPQISFNANYTWAQGGRTIDIPIGDLLNPVYGTLNQLMNENAFPQLDNVSEQFLPNNFHQTNLALVQPLFNSDIYFGYKARQSLVEVERAKQAAYENELRHEIRSAYFRHLQALEGERIYRDARTTLKELARVSEKLVAQQKATPDVLSNAAAEIARIDQRIAEAVRQVASSRAFFNFLLNREREAEVAIDPALLTPEAPLPDLAPIETYSVAARQELAALRKGMEAQESLVEMKRYDAALPDLFVAAQAGFQGFNYTFDDKQDYWLVQVGLQWDLFQGGAKRNARALSEIEVRQLENDFSELQRQLELQSLDAWYACQAARSGLLAARSGLASATDAQRILARRYQEGQALWLELVQANNQLTAARQARSIAYFEYLLSFEQLHKSISQQ